MVIFARGIIQARPKNACSIFRYQLRPPMTQKSTRSIRRWTISIISITNALASTLHEHSDPATSTITNKLLDISKIVSVSINQGSFRIRSTGWPRLFRVPDKELAIIFRIQAQRLGFWWVIVDSDVVAVRNKMLDRSDTLSKSISRTTLMIAKITTAVYVSTTELAAAMQNSNKEVEAVVARVKHIVVGVHVHTNTRLSIIS